jgi:hypothetical protein
MPFSVCLSVWAFVARKMVLVRRGKGEGGKGEGKGRVEGERWWGREKGRATVSPFSAQVG